MNDNVFEKGYANQYDLFYANKDYSSECDLIEAAIRKYSSLPVKTILDLGCGTGSHSIVLSQRGYSLHGIDLSDDMLSQAVDKSQKMGLQNPPVFQRGDVRNFESDKKFDTIIMMFAVLGYQLSNSDVISTLQNARKHLKPGGVFIFDVWYGPAVLTIKPSERIKVIPTTKGEIIRAASGDLDTSANTSDVKFQIWEIDGGLVVNETKETHTMRYFFQRELEFLLQSCGMNLANISAFPSIDHKCDENTWNAFCVAK